jgi:hypothetical protein
MTKKAKDTLNKLNDKVFGWSKDEGQHMPSRVITTAGDITSLGINKAVALRALQGRKNLEGASSEKSTYISPSEKDVLKTMKKETTGKTYPISRFVTSPLVPLVANSLALGGALATGKPALVAQKAIQGSYGTAYPVWQREMRSRALKARAEDGRTGTGSRERALIQGIKKHAGQLGAVVGGALGGGTGAAIGAEKGKRGQSFLGAGLGAAALAGGAAYLTRGKIKASLPGLMEAAGTAGQTIAAGGKKLQALKTYATSAGVKGYAKATAPAAVAGMIGGGIGGGLAHGSNEQ